MNGSAILNLIVALGGGSLIGTVITLLFKRGITRAEQEQIEASATEVIARTASQAAKDIRESYAAMGRDIQTELDAQRRTNTVIMDENRLIKNQLSSVEAKLDTAISMLEHLGQDTSSLR